MFLIDDIVYSGFELCITSGCSPNDRDVSPETQHGTAQSVCEPKKPVFLRAVISISS